jgi:putative peptidoglycan lipid II flippase
MPAPTPSAGEVRVGWTSLLLVPIALASRGIAFLVPLAIAMWFGVGEITDAWYWALAFPTFALVLASTALGTAATPAMAAVRTEAPDRMPRFVGGLLTWTAVGSGSLGLLICVLAPVALPRVTAFPVETQELAGVFLWELLPFMVLTSAGAVLRVACEVQGRFTIVAVTPLVRASVVIATTWALLEPLGPHALPWGLVAGELLQAVWWAAWLRATGVHFAPSLRLDPAVRQVGRDLAPILGGEVLVALNIVVDKAFAGMLESGSVATLEYADRARVVPQTLLQSTLVMVAYATWSNLRAAGKIEDARRAVDQALRWTLALSAAPVAGMFIGRHVLVGLLYERGAFTAADSVATASVLAWYLPGVVPNLLGILAVRAHVVERNLRIVLILGLASMGANATFNALLVGPMGLDGLALATTINMALIPALYLWFLRDKLQIKLGQWGVALAVAGAAVAVALIVELGPGAPRTLADPVLWMAAAACFALLALAWRVTRPPQTAPHA